MNEKHFSNAEDQFEINEKIANEKTFELRDSSSVNIKNPSNFFDVKSRDEEIFWKERYFDLLEVYTTFVNKVKDLKGL